MRLLKKYGAPIENNKIKKLIQKHFGEHAA